MISLCALLMLTIGAGVSLAETNPVTAIVTNDVGQTADNLQEVFGPEFTFNPILQDSSEIIVTDIDKQAGFQDTVGYYKYGPSPSNFNQLWDRPENYKGNSLPILDSFGQFGLYLKPQGPTDTTTYYTQASLNPGQQSRVKVYQDKTIKTTFYVCFEDLTDNDYNDVIIKLSSVSVNVPEFPTVALPVAAILGLIFVFGRRKGDL